MTITSINEPEQGEERINEETQVKKERKRRIFKRDK